MPTKPDHAGDRHRGTHGRRRRQGDQALHTLDVDAEMEGLGLAEQQAVEGPGQRRQHEGDDQRERRHRQHLGPARAGQAAQHPQREVAQLAVVAGEGDEARQRGCEGAERDAGQQQRAGGELALARHQQHQGGGGGKAAAEGGDGQRIDAERLGPGRGKAVAQRDGRHRRQRRAGGDADQPGIGKRIAEHALHHRARDGERGAHECAEQQARQADVDQHELLAGGRGVGVAAGEAPDHAGQGGERDARRADRERQESGEREGQRRSRHQLAGATHARRVVSRTSHRHGRRHRVAPASPPARSG